MATTAPGTTPNGLTSDRLQGVATLRASVCPRGDDGGKQGHPRRATCARHGRSEREWCD